MATTTIQRRVARLEESAGGGECSRCGWGGRGPGGDDNRPYELRWIDPGGPDDREEFCEECGRQLVYVLTWGDGA
jgi:hypothetical protein